MRINKKMTGDYHFLVERTTLFDTPLPTTRFDIPMPTTSVVV